MTAPAITVKNLSKQYVLGGEVDHQKTFREMLTGLAREPFRRLRKLQGTSRQQETFWALKDIFFEVQPGEVLGIIGRNGAGKSTLLKILSRITAPTTGEIQYQGRLASLLEVGTGFHPELSGRENIFINGAILGMSKAEIRIKFDEIVDFAGIEQFLDTPVKRYSSGMYVRLAFAVAAHLDPDILVVDEVLAVGDVEFQKKCLGKMKEVAGQGRTVLFVSHNMATITGLCSSGIFLEKGNISYRGDIEDTVNKYTIAFLPVRGSDLSIRSHVDTVAVRITDVALSNPDGSQAIAASGKPFSISVQLTSRESMSAIGIQIGLYDYLGRKLTVFDSGVQGQRFEVEKGDNEFCCQVESLPIFPGLYSLNVAVNKGLELLDGVERCLDFSVESGDFFGTGNLPPYGPLLIKSCWVYSHKNR